MPDHTTASAAAYLAERGYTVRSGRIGGTHSPKADTIKRWCETGKVKGRKVSTRLWLIDQEELDRLLRNSKNDRSRGDIAHKIAPADDLRSAQDDLATE